MQNLFKYVEIVKDDLGGICPRCKKETLEKKGDHIGPRLVCNTCGLKIRVASEYNENVWLLMALIFMAGLGLVAWIGFLMQSASV